MKITFRHYAEYVFIEECLKSIEKHLEYEVMKNQLWRFGVPGVWPHVFNTWAVEQLDAMGLVTHSRCGDAEFRCISAREYTDFVLEELRSGRPDILWRNDRFWDTDAYIAWYQRLRELRKECR